MFHENKSAKRITNEANFTAHRYLLLLARLVYIMHGLEQVCETEWFIIKFLSVPFLTHLCDADVCHPYDFVLRGCKLDLKSVLVSCCSLSTTAKECCIEEINRIVTRGKSIVKSVVTQLFRRKTPPVLSLGFALVCFIFFFRSWEFV